MQTRFARATFEPDTEPSDAEPSLEVSVRDDGMVVFTRHGLGRIREGTVVALAITVKGFDVTLKERITAASSHAERMYARLESQDADASASGVSSMCCKSTALDAPEHKDGIEDFDKTAASASSHPVNMSAVFVLDFFAPEWYHIQYINEHDGRFAAFTLHVRPGIHTRRPFKQ
ncbi:unknown [Prevotella sp. CAG:873]|nr:unknown [Prevotella sp. CAG:873]